MNIRRTILACRNSRALPLRPVPTPARADFKKTKIAVLDFQMQGEQTNSKDMGKIVAEWLITGLVETGRFDVIERRLLEKLLEEQKLGVTGAIDPNSAAQLGKVLGVKIIVSGTVTSLEGYTEINARLIKRGHGNRSSRPRRYGPAAPRSSATSSQRSPTRSSSPSPWRVTSSSGPTRKWRSTWAGRSVSGPA